MPWLISAVQLDNFRKSLKNILVLDASWHLPKTERDARQEFSDKHIAGANFFDLNTFHDENAALPNMLIRDEKIISEKLSALGLRNDYKIIFYDNSDLHTSARALWMMRLFGHNPHQLYILDGGIAAWEKYEGKMESGDTSVTPKQYTAQFQENFIRTLDQMKKNLQQPTEQVVDLRHAVRFSGGPETRAGLRSGHIPGSVNFPFEIFFDKEGFYLPEAKIRKRLIDVGIDPEGPIVTLCGSGISASVLNFMLDIFSNPHHAVYDGSWTEWGSENLFPGENSLDERPVETCVG